MSIEKITRRYFVKMCCIGIAIPDISIITKTDDSHKIIHCDHGIAGIDCDGLNPCRPEKLGCQKVIEYWQNK